MGINTANLPQASYYDSIGLLAICDAIEAVEGIPITSYSLTPTKLLSSLDSITVDRPKRSLPSPYPPPNINERMKEHNNTSRLQHMFLSHTPAHLSNGATYAFIIQQQQNQFNIQQAELQKRFLLYQRFQKRELEKERLLREQEELEKERDNDSASASRGESRAGSSNGSGGGAGNVSESGNTNTGAGAGAGAGGSTGASGSTGGSTSGNNNTSNTTTTGNQSTESKSNGNHNSNTHTHTSTGDSNITPPNTNAIPTKPPLLGISTANKTVTNTAIATANAATAARKTNHKLTSTPVRSIIQASPSTTIPINDMTSPIPLAQEITPSTPEPTLTNKSKKSRSSKQTKPKESPKFRTSKAEGSFKAEECPVCLRTFNGPKASTHKQQHIRRLHFDQYTPKRGGKKRVIKVQKSEESNNDSNTSPETSTPIAPPSATISPPS